MRFRRWSRRELLKASAASAAGVVFAEPLRAAAPQASAVTPGLIEAARKEGKFSFYTALELNVAERLARMFEAKYPGIAVRVERSGAERIFQRIAQEQGAASRRWMSPTRTDPAHYLDWKKQRLAGAVSAGRGRQEFPADQIDPDGTHATACAWLEAIGYNTRSGQARGRAEKLRRPARSEMAGQDRQGPSRLQRCHPDRDLRARRATSAGRISKSWRSRRSCRCNRQPTRRRRYCSASAP